MHKLLLCTLIVLAAAVPSPATAQLASTEQELVTFIDRHHPPALDLLERVVNINSGTMNFEGVRAVGDVFEAEYEEMGFETRWVDGTPFGRAGHLIAEWHPDGPERLHVLLIGHLDTVFEPDSPFQEYVLIDEHHARGPGTTDMKGGNVIMLQALAALKSVGTLDSLRVTVVLIGDEEKSGRPLSLARADLVEAAKAADVALGFEDGDGDPTTAVVTRRGASRWQLVTSGTPSHSSQVFTDEVGAGAAFEAARILNAFYERLSDEKYLTFNPGIIVGGTDVGFDPEQARGEAFGKDNVVAREVNVSGDLRAVSPEQLEAARKKMQEIVADNLPGTSAEISFLDGYPPMAPTDGNRRLLRLYDAVSRDLGLGPVDPVDPRDAGAADITFAAQHVEMAMDGIGLMGTGGHTLEETADLRTLPSQTKRAALLLYRLARQHD